MCGRFTLTKDEDFIDYRFSKKSAAKLNPNYNIAPSSNIAVISSHQPAQISNMKWGWSHSLSSASGLIINARSESVFEKKIYENAINNYRCLIIADGYIEWKSTPYGKQPFLIKFENEDIFTFAGIFRRASKIENNYECLILTTNANNSVSHIHKRMPLILSKEFEEIWIKNKMKKEDFDHVFSSNSENILTSFPIDKNINKVSNNFPQLLNPIQENLSLFD